MRGTVVKPFPWSPDGIRVEHLSTGEEREFGAFFTGLSDFGYVDEVQALEGAPEIGAFTGAPANKENEAPPAPPADAGEGTGDGSPAPAGSGEAPPENKEGEEQPSDAQPTSDAAAAPIEQPAPQPTADLEVKHVGRGKYAVYRGEYRLTEEPLTKAEAEARLAELKG